MINAEHDFTLNFCNAIGYDNEFMLKDIIIDEVARQIVENKNDVVKLLRSNNLNATINDPNNVIAGILINEIAKGNKSITTGIADMISKNRFEVKKFEKTFKNLVEPVNTSTINTSIGQTSTTQDKQFWSNLTKILENETVQNTVTTLISNGLEKAYSKDTPNTTSENTANLNERLKINQTRQASQINYKKIVIISGIVIVVGILIVQIVKLKNRTGE